MLSTRLSYIREKEGKYQFRLYNSEYNISYTNESLSKVISFRNSYLGYDPDKDDERQFTRGITKIEEPLGITKIEEPLSQQDYVTFGVVSDTHLGSRYERLDALNRMYDIFFECGVKTVFHCGNYVDGEAHFNRYDLHTVGMAGQIEYFINEYPLRTGIKTYFVAGDDHEGWWQQRDGVEIGSYTELEAKKAGRNDLVYLGYVERDVVMNIGGDPFIIRVLHTGGGSSKGISLSGQNIVDSYHWTDTVDMLLVGHLHKTDFLPYYNGTSVVQAGCFQEQTTFMRKRKIIPAIGGWIIDVTKYDQDVWGIGGEYVAFPPKKWTNQLRHVQKVTPYELTPR